MQPQRSGKEVTVINRRCECTCHHMQSGKPANLVDHICLHVNWESQLTTEQVRAYVRFSSLLNQ